MDVIMDDGAYWYSCRRGEMRAVTSQLQAYQQQPMYQQPTPRGTRREQSANIGAPVGRRRSPKRKKKRRKPSVAPAPHAVAPSPLPSPEEKIPAAAKEAAKHTGNSMPVVSSKNDTTAQKVPMSRISTKTGPIVMQRRSKNAKLLVRDPSVRQIELRPDKDGMVRVSTSCLLNIMVDSNQHMGERFLLLLNSARKEKGEIEYGPSGGSYVCSEEGMQELTALGAKDFEGKDGAKKMRFRLPTAKLDEFERWFREGKGTGGTREEAVRGILEKEIVTEEAVITDKGLLEQIEIHPAGFVRQR
jgi:hypothetical protein